MVQNCNQPRDTSVEHAGRLCEGVNFKSTFASLSFEIKLLQNLTHCIFKILWYWQCIFKIFGGPTCILLSPSNRIKKKTPTPISHIAL